MQVVERRMPQDRYQTRLPADTADKVDTYVDEHEISEAEGVRRLIQTGLEIERDDGEIVDTRGKATARINETARAGGGLVIGLMVFLLLLLEVGAI